VANGVGKRKRRVDSKAGCGGLNERGWMSEGGEVGEIKRFDEWG